MDEILNKNVRDWLRTDITKKLRKWTVDLWGKWQDIFDKPYCLLSDNDIQLYSLMIFNKNIFIFYTRMVSSIEELKLKDVAKKYDNDIRGQDSFFVDIQVLNLSKSY